MASLANAYPKWQSAWAKRHAHTDLLACPLATVFAWMEGELRESGDEKIADELDRLWASGFAAPPAPPMTPQERAAAFAQLSKTLEGGAAHGNRR